MEMMSWTCPHSGEAFELEFCNITGRRVFNKQQLRERVDANWPADMGAGGGDAVTFAESRKQITKEKGKARKAEAKVKRQEKLEDATRAGHAGSIKSLLRME